jgi:hypothetical protein
MSYKHQRVQLQVHGEEVESNEVVARKKCVKKEQRKDLSSKVQVTLTHGDTTLILNFE